MTDKSYSMRKIGQPEISLVKLIIIGDCAVGKTNILMRFCKNQFKMNYVATIGVDFKVKTVDIDGDKIKFQIWDTAGQERYKTIAQTYYKGAAGIVLVYSIEDQTSFKNIEKWLTQIKENSDKGMCLILVGNKKDLQQGRKVQEAQGRAFANKHDMKFLEVSAKTGQNINQIFQELGKDLLQNYLPYHKTRKNLQLDEVQNSQSACKC